MRKGQVNCDNHGWIEGYIICRCILDKGAPVDLVFRPENNRLGDILCSRGGPAHQVGELTLICRRCALERGFINWVGDNPKVSIIDSLSQ
jgi:hypothetical protein